MNEDVIDVLDRVDAIARIVVGFVVSMLVPVAADLFFGGGYLWLAVLMLPDQIWYGVAALGLFHIAYDRIIGSRWDW